MGQTPERPSYDGTGLREVLDNGGATEDRYVFVFEDGTALAVPGDGRWSFWLDDHADWDRWTLATRVAWEDLPPAVRDEVHARCRELHVLLTREPR